MGNGCFVMEYLFFGFFPQLAYQSDPSVPHAPAAPRGYPILKNLFFAHSPQTRYCIPDYDRISAWNYFRCAGWGLFA